MIQMVTTGGTQSSTLLRNNDISGGTEGKVETVSVHFTQLKIFSIYVFGQEVIVEHYHFKFSILVHHKTNLDRQVLCHEIGKSGHF